MPMTAQQVFELGQPIFRAETAAAMQELLRAALRMSAAIRASVARC